MEHDFLQTFSATVLAYDICLHAAFLKIAVIPGE
jgi:hypothetical protein